jgi:hypothetical protein
MDLPTKLDVQRPSQKYLACPARFERATYALEEFVAVQKANNYNDLSQKTSTVQQTVQWVRITRALI